MRPSTYPLVAAEDAAATVLERVPVLEAESVGLAGCAGRVLAADLVCDRDLPAFRSSAVDGYAIRTADGAAPRRVAGESAAGRPLGRALAPGEAARVMTGGVVPEGADAVAMVEDADERDGTVRLGAVPGPGVNFHAAGADARAGDLAVPAGTRLGAAEVGLAAALGRTGLAVHRRPRVALTSTGDELVEAGGPLAPGQIHDSNRWALAAALAEAGAEVTWLGAAPDRAPELRSLVEAALATHDVLLTSGGVSVGSHDLVKPLLEDLGEVHIGRVRLRPGKPFTFATLPGGRVAFGLPGFPVSSLVTFEVFVRPALRRMQGARELHRPLLPVRLGYRVQPPGDRTEYQRVRLRREGAELVAESTGSQASSRLLSLAGAHALVRVPAGSDGFAAGTLVDAIVMSLPGAA